MQQQIPPQHYSTLALTSVSVFSLLTLFLFMIDFVPEARVDAHTDEARVVAVASPDATHTHSRSDAEHVVRGSSTGTVSVESTTDPTTEVSSADAADFEEAEQGRSSPLPAGDAWVTGAGLPVRVTVPSVEIDTVVVTPASTDVTVLDRALMTGAVHYPESATAGEVGNVLIFGHSSYLPVVKNKAYQAFNGLGSVRPGEQVYVYSGSHRYTYVVDEVWLARADEVVISFDAPTRQLTLATCNTFGAKQERWVLRATQVEARDL